MTKVTVTGRNYHPVFFIRKVPKGPLYIASPFSFFVGDGDGGLLNFISFYYFDRYINNPNLVATSRHTVTQRKLTTMKYCVYIYI